jgi:predicted nucleic acid-binding protein
LRRQLHEKRGIVDATVIKGFIETSGLKILRFESRSSKDLRRQTKRNLAKGDEGVLSLALSEKANEIITNDDGLGKIAMGLGIRVVASPDLLTEALRKGILDIQDFEVFLRGLVVENRLNAAVAELYLMEGRKNVKG